MSSAYQVIARKWRPRTFADVVGQDHVVRTLRNAIARQRIAHAYLFVGPRGTGKTSTARIFAKALNCTGGPNADFDPADPACVAIAEGSHLDVIEIDGASNNGVDQVRDLRETVRYAPAQGRFKVYIIDEVHMLSAAAFNALLKTLEEPPAHVKFIFATTDPQKVLPTIVSRCQRFDLKPIPDEVIVTRLQLIATAEGIQADPAALACIARLADGGMRDAQSILDQMISFCGTTVTEPDVLEVYGLVSAAQVAELAGAVAAGDQRRIVALVDACDVVVTTSNVTAHVAGAIGKKAVVLVPAGKGLLWYWQGGANNLWYPSLTRVTQSRTGDWGSAIATAASWVGENT